MGYFSLDRWELLSLELSELKFQRDKTKIFSELIASVYCSSHMLRLRKQFVQTSTTV